jgi:hypothetical protein
LALQQAATTAGIPGFGELLTAAIFEHLQIFVMPMLHMSVESFIEASEHADLALGSDLFFEGSTYTQFLQFFTWDQMLCTAIEMPCACAFQLFSSFAKLVSPSGQSWNLPSTSETDWGPSNLGEPVDLSDARGWELAVALTRLTEKNLVAAFNVVPRDDPYFEYLAANALQVLVD